MKLLIKEWAEFNSGRYRNGCLNKLLVLLIVYSFNFFVFLSAFALLFF
jgi:hypothetical protein